MTRVMLAAPRRLLVPLAVALAVSCHSTAPIESGGNTPDPASAPASNSSTGGSQAAPGPSSARAAAASSTTTQCPAGDARVTQSFRGEATYYSDALAGHKTASGEPYKPQALTAAHRKLPFGTLVRVRRLDGNQQSVCVRINDRGPFGSKSRIIDLSKAAARALSMLRAGVVPVVVEVLKQ